MRRRSDEEKRELLAEWRASGLSRAAFARQQGVSPSSLYRWRRALERPAFVEVVAAEPTGSAFVLRLPRGVEVDVSPGFDAAELRRLVQALC